MSANAKELATLIYPDIPHVPNPTQRERNKRLTNLRRNRAEEIISAYLTQQGAAVPGPLEGEHLVEDLARAAYRYIKPNAYSRGLTWAKQTDEERNYWLNLGRTLLAIVDAAHASRKGGEK